MDRDEEFKKNLDRSRPLPLVFKAISTVIGIILTLSLYIKTVWSVG